MEAPSAMGSFERGVQFQLDGASKAANLRVDVVDASKSEWASLGSCNIPLGRLDEGVQSRFAMRLAPCVASVAKYYGVDAPRVRLHAHLEVGRSPTEMVKYMRENRKLKRLGVDCSRISSSSSNIALVVGVFCPDINERGLSGLGWSGHFPDVDAIEYAMTQCRSAHCVAETATTSFDVNANAPHPIDSGRRNKLRASVLEFGGACLAEIVADLPTPLPLDDSPTSIYGGDDDGGGGGELTVEVRMSIPDPPEPSTPVQVSGGFQSLRELPSPSPTSRHRPPAIITKPKITKPVTQMQAQNPAMFNDALAGIRDIQRQLKTRGESSGSRNDHQTHGGGRQALGSNTGVRRRNCKLRTCTGS